MSPVSANASAGAGVGVGVSASAAPVRGGDEDEGAVVAGAADLGGVPGSGGDVAGGVAFASTACPGGVGGGAVREVAGARSEARGKPAESPDSLASGPEVPNGNNNRASKGEVTGACGSTARVYGGSSGD